MRMWMTSLSLRARPLPQTVQAKALVVGSPVLVAFETEPGLMLLAAFELRSGCWFTVVDGALLLPNCASVAPGKAGITAPGRMADE